MSPRQLASVLFTVVGVAMIGFAVILAIQMLSLWSRLGESADQTFTSVLAWIVGIALLGLALIVLRRLLSVRLPDDQEQRPSAIDARDLVRVALVTLGLWHIVSVVPDLVAAAIAALAPSGDPGLYSPLHVSLVASLALGALLLVSSRTLASVLWPRPRRHADSS